MYILTPEAGAACAIDRSVGHMSAHVWTCRVCTVPVQDAEKRQGALARPTMMAMSQSDRLLFSGKTMEEREEKLKKSTKEKRRKEKEAKKKAEKEQQTKERQEQAAMKIAALMRRRQLKAEKEAAVAAEIDAATADLDTAKASLQAGWSQCYHSMGASLRHGVAPGAAGR